MSSFRNQTKTTRRATVHTVYRNPPQANNLGSRPTTTYVLLVRPYLQVITTDCGRIGCITTSVRAAAWRPTAQLFYCCPHCSSIRFCTFVLDGWRQIRLNWPLFSTSTHGDAAATKSIVSAYRGLQLLRLPTDLTGGTGSSHLGLDFGGRGARRPGLTQDVELCWDQDKPTVTDDCIANRIADPACKRTSEDRRLMGLPATTCTRVHDSIFFFLVLLAWGRRPAIVAFG
ncbi:hypothetical protein BJ166DRAFT_221838 [Pestalotiopsis sp. NC0098]|nr:hypothetical protein BJ166DRAFT_221838 [Pestalotiopsis sp. NC0098]